MAETPMRRLMRLLGGVALSQGRVPHQVLGQLLITDATAVEFAGANVVIAATSGVPSTMAQVAVRTAAPSLALQGVADRQTRRLKRIALRTQERERRVTKVLQQVEEARANHQNWIGELARAQARLDTRAAEAREELARADALRAEAVARSEEIDRRDAELRAQAEARHAEIDRRDAELQGQAEARHAEIDRRSAELQAEEIRLEQRAASLQTNADQLQRRANELDAEADRIVRRAAELRAESAALEERSADLERREAELREAEAALEGSSATSSEDSRVRAELERDNERLREEIAVLRAVVDRLPTEP